jgi:hypothetical protein
LNPERERRADQTRDQQPGDAQDDSASPGMARVSSDRSVRRNGGYRRSSFGGRTSVSRASIVRSPCTWRSRSVSAGDRSAASLRR